MVTQFCSLPSQLTLAPAVEEYSLDPGARESSELNSSPMGQKINKITQLKRRENRAATHQSLDGVMLVGRISELTNR